MLAGAAVFFGGSLVMAAASDVYWLIGGRVVVGLAIGVASVVGPLYISEIAPPAIRGSLVSFNQLAVTIGILCAYFVNYAFSGAGAWRYMLGAGMVPAAVLALGMAYMPESPRWLFENGRAERARQILRRSHSDEQVETEIAEIREAQAQEEAGLAELLKPWVRPALVVGIGLAIFQQVTGINTVIYYAPTILNQTGLSASSSIIATVGIGLINVAMTVVAIALVDRVGRRKLLLTGLGGMVVMLAILGGVFYVGLGGALGWAATVCLMLFVGSFAIGLGPVFWLLISEIYPTSVRGSAMGAASLCNWAANLVMGLSFLSIVDAIGTDYTFWALGVLTLVALLFSNRLVPETKGRTLEEIEADLRERYLTQQSGEFDGESDYGAD
nr:sugar porter family MFS transporter [Halarchaeum acidiphilum]